MAEAGEDLLELPPDRADVAGVPDRLAQPLEAAIGVDDSALTLGVRLGRQDHIGVLGHAAVQELGERDDEGGAVESAFPAATVRVGGKRIAVKQDQRAGVAAGKRLGDCGGTAPLRRCEAGAEAREQAKLAKPAAIRARGDLEQSRPGRAGDVERLRQPKKSIDRVGAARPIGEPLTPDDHDRLSSLERRGKAANRIRISTSPVRKYRNWVVCPPKIPIWGTTRGLSPISKRLRSCFR